MPLIQPTNQPVFYVIQEKQIDGTTYLGESTGINNDLSVIAAEGEAAFLDATKTIGSYRPLPSVGTPLVSGEMYGYNGGLVIVRQSHGRTTDLPEKVPALFSVYRSGQGVLEWIANEEVCKGSQRTYNGNTYKCLQAHTTQVDWTPPSVIALWALIPVGNVWGAGVAYKVNDIVTYTLNGFSYKCLQAHTSQAGWNPPAVPALWKKQ